MKLLNKLYEAYISSFGDYEKKRCWLIKKGAKIGEGTKINARLDAFGTEPYLVEVGKDCLFAFGIKFLTHDGGIKVLNSLNKFEKKCDKVGRIVVGNNVYIGMDAFIMPNVTIGDNCIIGAKAVVTKDVPANSVYAGVPARKICDLDEYYEKVKDSVHFTVGMPYDEKRKYYEAFYAKENEQK